MCIRDLPAFMYVNLCHVMPTEDKEVLDPLEVELHMIVNRVGAVN